MEKYSEGLDQGSGVATYGALGHVNPLEFWKFCAFCSCWQLNCRDFENYQRKACIKFSSIPPETR